MKRAQRLLLLAKNMQIPREEALAAASSKILDTATFVRAVLSGRRRNMQVEFERIDIRLVEIKGILNLQLMQNDGRATTTKNLLPEQLAVDELLDSGYANITVESTHEAYSVRITKSGEAQVHTEKRESEQNLAHDKKKDRLLDSNDPFLREVGIADAKGVIKPSRQDKYKQVEEFLRLLSPTLNAAIEAGQIHKPTAQNPLRITDLGCGHAYLTFGVLFAISIPTSAIASTAIGLIESLGALPAERTSTRPCPSSRMNPAAICERPALWTQTKRTVGLFVTL